MQVDDERFAEIVATAIKMATAPLVARLVSLEQRTAVVPKDGTPGRDGKDADEAVVMSLQADILALKAELELRPVAMEPLALPDIPALVKAAVEAEVSRLPVPKDGAQGEPGQSVAREDVLAMVKAAVDEIPRPENGRSVTVDDIAPMIDTAVKSAVDALPRAKDGISVVDALVDRDGQLIQTFSDGRTKSVGTVVGRDVDMAFVLQRIDEAVASLPKPKDGRDGSLEGVKIEQLDEETVQFQRADGTPIEGGTVHLSGFFDKGVWRDGETYRKGYAVTFGGSVFIAQRETTSKPETDDSWRLAVKRGRDGRNGKDVAAVVGPVRLHG